MLFCCSVAKLCLTLCDPMGSRLLCPPLSPGNLLRFMSIGSMMPSNHLVLCCPFLLCFQSFQASGSFPMSPLFTLSGQSIGVSASASASILPMNIQGWCPLGFGLVSLQKEALNFNSWSNRWQEEVHHLACGEGGIDLVGTQAPQPPVLFPEQAQNMSMLSAPWRPGAPKNTLSRESLDNCHLLTACYMRILPAKHCIILMHLMFTGGGCD